MSATGHKRFDAYPYRYGGEELGFEFTAYDLDNGSTQSLSGTVGLELSAEASWSTGTLTVKLSVTQSTLDRVFPGSPPYDGALAVVAYCPTNHHRYETIIADTPLTAGTYSDTVPLEYEMLRGRVELTPLLVRTKPLTAQPPGHSGPPFAERIGRKLAHGPTGRLDVDEPTGGKSKDLPTIPMSFSDPSIQADDGNMWYLNINDPAKPKLYINSDHGFVVPLFQDKGQHSRGRVRQLVVDLHGTQILTQFVLHAAELYAVDGDRKYAWQERMLTDVCGDLFEGKSAAEVAEMLEPGNLSDTMNSIATTVQRRRAPHEALERVLDLNL